MCSEKTAMDKAANAIAKACKKEKRMINAVDSVADTSEIPYGTLLGMRQAIDAWNDLNKQDLTHG